MSIENAAAFAIIGSILCLVLREYQKPQAVLLAAGVTVLLLLGMLPEVQHIVQTASGIFSQSGLDSGYFSVLCKAVGIAWITRLGTDLCRDCGEGAIASAVELCGRICLTVLALPLFLTVAETVMEVME